jgi:predicted kinase
MKAVRLNTVFLLIGPTNCGKSHFAKNFLIPRLRSLCSEPVNVQYLSTDETRKQLLDRPSISKYQQAMVEASGPTFDLLYYTLRKATEFPVNAEFVVVDSTGLSPEFRKKISDICRENLYHLDLIIFQYRERDYFTLPGGRSEVIRRHLGRMKHLLSSLKEICINNKHFIKEPKATLELNEVADWELRQQTRLDPSKRYFVIGDVHGCYDQLLELLRLAGFEIDEGVVKSTSQTLHCRVVLIGDLIDKGPKVKEVLKFVAQNLRSDLNLIDLVLGNHENTVHRLLHGINKESQYEADILQNYFSTYFELKNDEELVRDFEEVHRAMRPFLRYASDDEHTRSFLVSHSPCALRHLGKTNGKSLKAQMYCHIDRDRDVTGQMIDIIGSDRDQYNYPYHVFGHVRVNDPYLGTRDGNSRIGIDTGCAEGGLLTGVWLGKGLGSPKFASVKGHDTAVLDERRAFQAQETPKNYDLAPFEQQRLKRLIRHRVNFLSGTISPADKSVSRSELESLAEALDYYQKRDVPELILQNKYMGSRCNVYLNCRELDSSYAISRNGYRISGIAPETMLSAVYEPLYRRLEPFIAEHKAETVIVDGELMPWDALGKDLIESQFRVIDHCLKSELETLRSTGLETLLEEAHQKMAAISFGQRASKALKESLGDTDYTTMKSLSEHERIDLTEDESYWANYHEQLQLYGQSGPLEFRAFNLLKVVGDDFEAIPFLPGSRIYLNQEEIFRLVSSRPDDCCVVDLRKEDGRQQAEDFYQRMIQGRMEGVVIKPLNYTSMVLNTNSSISYAPFLKVRNPAYLSIIYGYNYQKGSHYQRLIKQKQIKRKIQKSIVDFQQGIKLLAIPYSELKSENEKLVNLWSEILSSDGRPEEIDPRL